MNLREDSLAEALRAFASSSLMTGGGGAAALTGALGAALLCMVARRGLAKEPDSKVGRRLNDLLAQGTGYQRRLEDLMIRDAEAYGQVAKALRKVKRDPQARDELRVTLEEATLVPLDTAKASLGCLSLASDLAEIGIPTTITEVGTGAYLCHAAMQSALCTAADNLRAIGDPAFEAAVSMKLEAFTPADDLLRKVSERVAELTGMNETLRRFCVPR